MLFVCKRITWERLDWFGYIRIPAHHSKIIEIPTFNTYKYFLFRRSAPSDYYIKTNESGSTIWCCEFFKLPTIKSLHWYWNKFHWFVESFNLTMRVPKTINIILRTFFLNVDYVTIYSSTLCFISYFPTIQMIFVV